MKGNNKNDTGHYKGRKRFFSGKTKHILMLLSAILLLTSVLTLSLAASQAAALPVSNGYITLNANTVSTQGVSSKSDTSLVGSNLTNPAIMDIRGNILMGEHSPDKVISTNMTTYYQLIESNGTGFIGTGYTGPDSSDNNTLPLWPSDCIRVPQGNGYLLIYDEGSDKIYVGIKFNHTHAVIYDQDEAPSIEIPLEDYGITDGKVNITQLVREILDPNYEPEVIWAHGIMWNESMTLESWGPWFGVVNGIINMTDTHLHIESEGSVLFEFLNSTMEVNGTSFIKGPVSISAPLKINNGTMTGTGTIDIPDGYMQTFGSMRISNGEISSGSPWSITGESLSISGTVVSAGSVMLSGTFLLTVPMGITGSMVTMGINGMGGLGTISGVMTVRGDIVMSGLTMISGDNNILGSMTVTPVGVFVSGVVGLMGIVQTSNTPAIGSSTILEMNSASLMGLPIPHVSILANPLVLVALGILGIGAVWVVVRSVYYGIKYRRTWPQRVRETVKSLGRRLSGVQLKSGKG